MQDVDSPAGTAHGSGKGNVFQEIILHGSVSANLLVPIAIEQHELPVGECLASIITIDPVRRIQGHQRHTRHRLCRSLEPVRADKIRQQTQQRRVSPLRLTHGRPKKIWIGLRIRIDKYNPIAFGVFGANPSGMAFPRPRLGAVGIANERHSVILVHAVGNDGFGSIGTAIGDDDDLEPTPSLREQRIEAIANHPLLIVGWHDNGHQVVFNGFLKSSAKRKARREHACESRYDDHPPHNDQGGEKQQQQRGNDHGPQMVSTATRHAPTTIRTMPRISQNRIRVFDRAAGRQLDAESTSRYGIPGLVLMENAAAGAAEIAMEMLDHGGSIAVFCGPGNNGGDGWAMARHLHNAGHDVRVIARTLPREGSPAFTNATIAERMGLVVHTGPERLDAVDLIIDALLGTGIDREVTGLLLDDIHAINAADLPVLAVDLPSGMDADTGQPLGAAVRATATATFAGWKKGFLELEALRWTGDIHTIDIGAPLELHMQLGEPLCQPRGHGR